MKDPQTPAELIVHSLGLVRGVSDWFQNEIEAGDTMLVNQRERLEEAAWALADAHRACDKQQVLAIPGTPWKFYGPFPEGTLQAMTAAELRAIAGADEKAFIIAPLDAPRMVATISHVPEWA